MIEKRRPASGIIGVQWNDPPPLPPPLPHSENRDALGFIHIYYCEWSPNLARAARWCRSVIRCFMPEPTYLDGPAVSRHIAAGLSWKEAIRAREVENTEKLLRWRQGHRV